MNSYEKVRYAAQNYGPAMVNVLAKIALHPGSPPSCRVGAATALLDRGYGRPPQAIAVAVDANIGLSAEGEARFRELARRVMFLVVAGGGAEGLALLEAQPAGIEGLADAPEAAEVGQLPAEAT